MVRDKETEGSPTEAKVPTLCRGDEEDDFHLRRRGHQSAKVQ